MANEDKWRLDIDRKATKIVITLQFGKIVIYINILQGQLAIRQEFSNCINHHLISYTHTLILLISNNATRCTRVIII